MSKIFATDNFQTQNWKVTFKNLDPRYADLFIGFTDDAPIVEFKDLKFKYELKQNGNIKHQGVYPPPNITYVNSTETYIVTERLFYESETEYQLYLWVENDGKSFETTVNFTTP